MKMWCAKWPNGCRRCRTKTRTHAGQGYCSRCYHLMRKRGLSSSRRGAKIRVRDAETQFFCYDCSSWKSTTHFYVAKSRTMCRACRSKLRRTRYAENRDHLNAIRRERAAREAEERRQADIRRARNKDPWAHRPVVPIELVRSWLDRLLFLHDGSVQQVGFQVGMSDRRIRSIYEVEQDKVTVDLAEKIARAVDAVDELNAVLPIGVEGWSRYSTHCLRCGRYDLRHQAKGLCRRCYENVRYHRARGREAPLPRDQRWARWYLACVRCGRTAYRHQGKGVCSGCYQQVRRERRAAQC